MRNFDQNRVAQLANSIKELDIRDEALRKEYEASVQEIINNIAKDLDRLSKLHHPEAFIEEFFQKHETAIVIFEKKFNDKLNKIFNDAVSISNELDELQSKEQERREFIARNN